MSNKDIVVSSEKGTILNYFGVANTYNPFTNESNMQLVEDLDFKIPERTAIVDAEWVAVSTGLITTYISFLQNCTFQIIDKNSGAKITDLTNIIGEVGNTRFMPSESQIFWFNVEGLKGTFYIHKNYCGHYLKIVSGVFVSTSITSGVLNEMFERSIGVPNYITNISNTINEQNRKINDFQNDFQNQINNIYTMLNGKAIYREVIIEVPTTGAIYKKNIDGILWVINYTAHFNVYIGRYRSSMEKVSVGDIITNSDSLYMQAIGPGASCTLRLGNINRY
ncbi:phage tail protein [Brachyspira pilosicoli]|uniref:phage tail protein n=1 Tax=Brachyspira pilosicoli TaxID=52584 RepID=UPI0012F52282|nr:phage tail protein [Brachyspira pilosicoli]